MKFNIRIAAGIVLIAYACVLAYSRDEIFKQGDCYTFGTYRLVFGNYTHDECLSSAKEAREALDKWNDRMKKNEERRNGWEVDT